MESLVVRGFAGIKDANINIGQFTVFIGHQASGKSVCAKLIYYFRQIISGLALEAASGSTKTDIRKKHKANFIKYFPNTSWGTEQFSITYTLYAVKFTVKSKHNKAGISIDISYSETYDKILESLRKEMRKYEDINDGGYVRIVNVNGEDRYIDISPTSLMLEIGRKNISDSYVNTNYFVPAGRSFFSTLQSNVFSFISTSIDMDPFLIEFGRLYERMRNSYSNRRMGSYRNTAQDLQVFKKIVKGEYARISGQDYISSSGNRSIPIGSTSSGQQEVLPLLILLTSIKQGLQNRGANVFIEEPEAHLFPDTQKELIDYIFSSMEKNAGICLITTHSPYILSEINNMMYRGYLIKRIKLKSALSKLSDGSRIDPSKVEAYHFKDGNVSRIIDDSTGLIDASDIDKISNVISQEFDELMSIEAESLNV
ncbi:AAA family ATPase [Deinococcus xianganensis]|uniref:AAA family ATPase n=1 Tax=Deinococcus xianganensis TaxID=1507289 RepID=A0A6I4YPG6_9DEIO|nr:AAA family ATPase [Deinococcus xianganensis]MXV19365.1 AAA family ATPase [Deinococcus xianganensis]